MSMVQSYRHHQLKKGEHQHAGEDDMLSLMCAANSGYFKRSRPKLFSLLILSLLSCCLILGSHLFCSSSALSLLYSFGVESDELAANVKAKAFLCSSISNGTICCDRRSIRSDVCVMKGDVRTSSASSSVFLYTSKSTHAVIKNVSSLAGKNEVLQHEKVKPYTRKWETSVMDTIDELDLIVKTEKNRNNHHCDVTHDVPAVFFSTGGYTGNVYHEFNDGLLPLFITSQHFKKKVVFVILEYHDWWIMKYGDILSHLSDYPAIDFSGDKRTHCFPEAIVGLRIHDELTVDPSLMHGNKSIVDFRNVLDLAYLPRVKSLLEESGAQEKLNQKAHSSSSGSSSDIRGELGLKYIGYQILPRESSLYDKYDRNDPVLRDPTERVRQGMAIHEVDLSRQPKCEAKPSKISKEVTSCLHLHNRKKEPQISSPITVIFRELL
ncbi:EGF DOMAIN-SPECIFIC O-LINKED N-ACETYLGLUCOSAMINE TRANSFERASE-LIKE [Salix koriyanagi]|uniref:EGF DOMAIN-SPECIFIC O-LINKED N-ACETYLGLUCOSAMINE TRANSFERASE-LIKE n=1 Tax=Salix koriyanagi TaxID=2511006 RepID=A0A9Q0VEY0_9ROSI|nr:EGF DOMAIN-SPECIFIC O-LINKED N-ACETYLGLUCOSAMINE TRANSFERASE-LIKE [Salix koriyanagi]